MAYKIVYYFYIYLVILYIVIVIKYQITTPNDKSQEVFEEWMAKYNLSNTNNNDGETNLELKYILQWTSPITIPFIYMGRGRECFIKNKCPVNNCYVTNNRSYLSDLTKFDVLAFHGPEVWSMRRDQLPFDRSPRQKYAFASIESSHNYAICAHDFNDYFNWTWTYRLDSDVKWGYVSVRNDKNEVVGPKIDMHWMKVEDMDPVSDEIRQGVKTKTKAAAWFVSNCHVRSQREFYVKYLQKELEKYNLTVDIYGECGPLNCTRKNVTAENKCKKMLSRDYYFYLSFENSFSEYYVTEKLLMALENDVVPIVYGAANYTRFMPTGIYLNARELGHLRLAKVMNDLIMDNEKYLSFFKWKKYYRYHVTNVHPDTNVCCKICEILNSEKMTTESVVNDFRKWWNTPGRCIIKDYEPKCGREVGIRCEPETQVLQPLLKRTLPPSTSQSSP